jgi:alpha-galactosidase
VLSEIKSVAENGLFVTFEISDEKDVRLLHFSSTPCPNLEAWEDKKRRKFRLVEVHLSGENQNDHHGSKHTGSNPGNRLKLSDWKDGRNSAGRKLEIAQIDERTKLRVVSHFQFYDGIPAARTWTEVVNEGESEVGLEYVSSFALTGIDKEGLSTRDDKIRLHVPHNTWFGEAQWRSYTLPELGLNRLFEFSMKRLSFSSTGTWSSSQYAPAGMVENTETGATLFWQIEHHGSWQYEISDIAHLLYLHLSGPTEQEHQWWKRLEPGESFVSVPAAVGAVAGGFDRAARELTRYRRAIRRPNADNETLPVIFNDYMNCLFGDPTTEKLIPLIDAAAEAGCEYYCIDCGWYSDGEWWDGVGEWMPSQARFPGGIKEVIDYIRSKGMVPGLWLELEVMGIECRLASELPDDWFFLRHGKRVIDHSRYQLDFRNPEVRAFADRVIDRLVGEYGVGYIKMDYNINAGVGTDRDADSPGDGLLGHNRAYLEWLDNVFHRYPDLVIENCGSGGMRMDYALLSRHSIQSVSDQTDYLKNAVIAAASASLATPEQCAVWSYPLREGDREEAVMNMVNALLLRIHQSGHLAELSPERFALVREGIAYYKSIRAELKRGLPFWPLGCPSMSDAWTGFGLDCGAVRYVAVWRLEGDRDTCTLPFPDLKGRDLSVRLGYPSAGPAEASWSKDNGTLTVRLPHRRSARLFELHLI